MRLYIIYSTYLPAMMRQVLSIKKGRKEREIFPSLSIPDEFVRHFITAGLPGLHQAIV
ncbi:MAG: hypothetical protein ABIT96_10135 [Ferruginibacter sp.]